ncbi:pyrroloquinoline quinone biosynthesis peptide chaperone PqqD [Kushneria marisflavi]|uniref:Pyrroloquinoline quinone biosynthesis protein PqqD n=1 Tax=Kushneria marisflavi TaxID=157779 RepID=A0A240UL58_9GAMM|nr:pyrroloquinoline quinone biosynthesis peptide chaperone PqqD [Kushneria marisflavi]ART62231.1 pyrroloquinoline quinone biosynthesis protein PqqD [Kushneria marisflavi]RKD87318.1 pyrroloquinoline quinone biosynthesis protein D [Kushneria marisflavi]
MSKRLDDNAVVRLPRGVRMREDAARGGWVLLAPERIFQLDAIAHAIMSHVDGKRCVSEIIDALVIDFDAERDRIRHDVLALFHALIDRGVLEVVP